MSNSLRHLTTGVCRTHKAITAGFELLDFPGYKTIILFLLVFLFCASGQAQGFKVRGTLSLLQFTGSNSTPGESWTFEASALTNQWLYKVFFTNGQEHIFGCDGRDVYWLFQDPVAGKKMNLSMYVGCVFSGRYPVQSPFINTALPWLAYCSKDFMAAAVTNSELTLPAPWLSAWAMPLAYVYNVRYTPLEQGAGLPAELEYKPGAQQMEDLKNGIYHTVTKPTDSERDKAVLQLVRFAKMTLPEAIYQVTETTNFQGARMPAEFVFDNYSFSQPKSSSAVSRSLAQRVIGKLTSIESIDSLDPLPRSSDEITDISVGDYRFANSQSGVVFVSYLARKADWITDQSDPRLRDLYSEQAGIHAALWKTKLNSRFFVLLLFGVAAAIPLIFLSTRIVPGRPVR